MYEEEKKLNSIRDSIDKSVSDAELPILDSFSQANFHDFGGFINFTTAMNLP